MKVAIAILTGTIALTGCAAMQRDQNGSGSESFSAGSGEQQIKADDPSTLQRSKGETPSRESSYTSTHEVKSKRIPVTLLPKGTIKEVLNKLKGKNDEFTDTPIENLAFIAIFDRKGNISMIATQHGTHPNQTDTIPKPTKFPIRIRTEAILAIKPFAIATFKGSHYMVVTPATDEGGGHVEPELFYFGPPHPCAPDYIDWKDDC